MKKILLSLVVVVSLSTYAQTGIACDGTDDVMTVPNASAHFVGQNISMSFWVYPTNPNPGFPDFDGFAGFRSESTFDFYLLQLTATNVECRFRNNGGINYDIVYNGLVMNAWNHFVFTFNGSQTEVFHNGVSVGTTPASGTISNANVAFEIGKTQFGPPFWTVGKFDDAALWSRALTAAEVAALYGNCQVDINSPNLELLYEFEEGTPGQSNTSITTAIDSKGNQNGTYSGFSMTGTASNFVTGNGATYAADTVEACFTYTTAGGQTYTASGTYTDSLNSNAGCDSIVSLELTIIDFDLTVNQSGTQLTCAHSGALLYQWINCTTGQQLGTGQSYTPAQSGDYACIITDDGCQDTTACVTVTGFGLDEGLAARWSVSPNPSQHGAVLNFGSTVEKAVVRVVDLQGCIMYSTQIQQIDQMTLPGELPAGIYLVDVRSASARRAIKWIVK